jgi:hypothetical protein
VVSDLADPAPTFVLTSITSDEPDSGIGPSDIPVDILGATFGTPDSTFELRAERDPNGDGRVYTIVYTATDARGNSASQTLLVTVPIGQPGSAIGADGFTADGTGVLPGMSHLDLVIPSSAALDATMVMTGLVFIGNQLDALAPMRTSLVDATGDGLPDLVVQFDAASTLALKQASGTAPLAFYYQTDTAAYLVPDMFALGAPISTPAVGAPVTAGSLDLYRPWPNPFTGASRVSYAVTGTEPVDVSFSVYSVAGRLVRDVLRERRAPGIHETTWDGRDAEGRPVPSGVYLIRLRVAEEEHVLRVVRLR